MNDRELLELAAKAAGYEKIEYNDLKGSMLDIRYGRDEAIWNGEDYWNPLVDDYEALRLAVKLGFFIYQIKVDNQKITVVEWDFDHVGKTMIFDEMHKDDPYAATRRAIVRAAAEIGKGMK
jgi:hypothetical protein